MQDPSHHPFIHPNADGIDLRLKIIPGASKNRVVGPLGDELKVQVAAPPERGKANQAVVALIARLLQRPRADVRLISGQSSPHKVIHVRGISTADAAEKLGL